MLIAHLSDPHFDGTERARERAQRVVAYVHRLRPAPDVVLVTGDVADTGAPEQYGEAAAVFDGLGAWFLPGNHDRRAPMRAMLGLPPGDDPITAVHHRGGTTFVLCDTTVPDHDHGHLAEDSRRALVEAAAESGPLVVALHHPPVPVGSGLLDPIRLVEPERLIGTLAGRTGPTWILCGHVHVASATSVAGIPVRIAPAIASTLRLPWEPDPDTLDPAADPGLGFHHLVADDLVTHHRVVPPQQHGTG